MTELPLDAAFAAGFGALLRRRVGLRLPSAALVGTLATDALTLAYMLVLRVGISEAARHTRHLVLGAASRMAATGSLG